MLLKCANPERKVLIPSKGGGGLARGTGMRMTMSTASTMTPRIHRKTLRIPSKRHPGKVLPGKLHSMSRMGPGKITPGKRINPRPHPPPCDNSNDSGLGFDQHVEVQNSQQIMRSVATARSIPLDDDNRSDDESEDMGSDSSSERFKRRKIQSIQIDTDDACSNDAFIQKIATTRLQDIRNAATATNTTSSISSPAKYAMGRSAIRPGMKRQVPAVQNNISTSSKDGSVHLEIVSQPEQQHRARYQTEGSRGAVKDRSGNGFPVVKLTGYNKPAVLQVFIGTDIGRVAPHMFYQACKVAGKNSTPCNEKKVDGTMVIEIEFKPDNDMTITCDCVGILKERNVDVEHRFPDQSAQRSKKKSTRCRMVFRTQLARDDGSVETLQVCSLPIICTQPPGVPEVSKKSLNSCPVEGGLELFIIGKNFLKDTCVIFQDATEGSPNLGWEERVTPDKEFLQQTHLVCTVPPYINQNITKPINVHFYVMSSGKRSESHNFFYTPKGVHSPLAAATTISTLHGTLQNQDVRFTEDATNQSNRSLLWSTDVLVEPKHEIDSGMMPPPATLPLGVRRQSSSGNIISEQIAQLRLKTEMIEENSQSSVPDAAMQQDSLDQFPSANDSTVDRNSIQQYQRIRKSIDMLDMESMSTIINESNSLQNFPTHDTPMSVVVKQEQMAAQLQAAEMLSNGQTTQSVSKFLALESSLSKIKSQVDAPTAAAVSSMFVNSTNNSASVMFPPQHISDMTNMTTTVSNDTMEQTYNGTILTNSHPTTSNTLNQILNMQQNASPNSVSPNSSSSTLDQLLNMQQNSSTNSSPSSTTLNQILNMQQNPSPNSVASSPSSNSSPLHGVHSPITQDIILNSQPAASINSINSMQLISPTNSTPTEHITTDIILNPTISPSMMCGTADQSNLMANPVTIANTMLADITMAPPPPPQQNLLSNMMMSSSPEQIHVPHRTSPVAVKNMIIKATTDFINNQENNLNTDQSTINALMSLNAGSGVLTDAQSQILNMSTPTQTTSNSNVLTRTEQQQHQQQQQQAMDICQSQTSLTQHLPMFGNTQTISSHRMMEGQALTSNNPTTMSSVPLQNILMTHEVTRNASNEFMHDITKAESLSSNITSQSNQESLLQAVSLVRSELEKPKMNGVEQIALPQQNNLVQPNTTQPATTTATIPQEITTMSDQDLISYINPSCFDQV